MAVSIEVIDGAEVRVETGKGLIQNADLEAQGRNVKVEFKATHTNLAELVGGWLDTQNNALYEAVREADLSRSEVEYVIHVKRKRDVDPSLSFAELSSRQKVRDLVSIKPAGGARRSDEPSPAQDVPRTPPAVQEPRPAPPATSGSPAPSIPEQGPAPARAVRRGMRVEEAKPWERTNGDGSVNLGSYEAQACIGLASLAYKLMLEKARDDADRTGGQVAAPSKANVAALARSLLQAADAAQAAVRADGCADRMDSSHTRARGAIREALDAYPVPWGATPEEKLAWRDTLATTAAMLLTTGVELMAVEYGSLETPEGPDTSPSEPSPEEPKEQAAPIQGSLVPANSEEADAVADAEEAGEDPMEALRQIRERMNARADERAAAGVGS